MVRRAPIHAVAVAASVAAVLAGCSKSENEQAPAACLEGPAAYERALRAAPGEVRLGEDTSISDCLVSGQEGGELAEVGSSMVSAATRLNQRARETPGGHAPVELGYLVGAAERGAEDTSGIHEDLIRRLTAAARFAPAGIPPEFESSYETGFEAGQESG